MEHHQPIRLSTILTASLAAGIAGDQLLRATPWGVNFSLWTAAVVGILVFVAQRLGDPLPKGSHAVAAGTLLTGAMLAIRDAADLSFWNAAATLAGVGLMAARTRTGTLLRSGIGESIGNLLLQGVYCSFGPLVLGFSVLQARRRGAAAVVPARWLGILRGTAVAVPALLLFGGLLTAADAGFEYFVEEVLHIDLATVLSHLLLTAVLAWLAAGFLHLRFNARETVFTTLPPVKGPNAGPTEMKILLGSLDVLFAAFVAFQVPYFFGGQSAVLGNPDLTYAEYARRGFFELITVAAVALPLLLGAEWTLRKDDPRALRLFRILAGVMLCLLLVMLVSAAHRLHLYTSVYGLTPARVHAAAVLVWLAFTLPWFGATVLRGRRERFFFGSAAAACGFLLLLNAFDPDALVARVNVTRFASAGTFDAQQAARLGAEAVPVLLESLHVLPPADRDIVARALLSRYGTEAGLRGWRSWNLALGRAERMVGERKEELRRMLIPPKKPEQPC